MSSIVEHEDQNRATLTPNPDFTIFNQTVVLVIVWIFLGDVSEPDGELSVRTWIFICLGPNVVMIYIYICTKSLENKLLQLSHSHFQR